MIDNPQELRVSVEGEEWIKIHSLDWISDGGVVEVGLTHEITCQEGQRKEDDRHDRKAIP